MVIYAPFLRALPTIQTFQYYQLLFVPTLLIMHLTELKNTPVSDLVKLGEEQMGLENLARLRKQDIVFAILKQHAKSGEDIFGGGVLEILPDGFGFLRSADSSYLAGPDDIYVLQVKFVASIFKLVIKLKAKSVHQKRANAILHF